MVWGCIGAHDIGCSHSWGGTMEAKQYEFYIILNHMPNKMVLKQKTVNTKLACMKSWWLVSCLKLLEHHETKNITNKNSIYGSDMTATWFHFWKPQKTPQFPNIYSFVQRTSQSVSGSRGVWDSLCWLKRSPESLNCRIIGVSWWNSSYALITLFIKLAIATTIS